jgi:hypothetical protein
VDGRSAFERGIERWGAYLREGEGAEEREALRRATHTGRPLGGGGFVKRLEKAQGRRLHALAPGRPAKKGRQV